MKKFFFAIVLIVISSCSEEKLEPQLVKEYVENNIPAHESWNSKITFSSDGMIKAVLFTKHLKKYEQEKVTLLDGVKIDFYNANHVRTSTLTSDKGKVNDATLDMYAIDNVVAVNDSGTVLKTQELKWRKSDHKIVTDKFVSIKSAKEIIEGYGFESDQNLHNYVIYNVTYSSTLSKKESK